MAKGLSQWLEDPVVGAVLAAATLAGALIAAYALHDARRSQRRLSDLHTQMAGQVHAAVLQALLTAAAEPTPDPTVEQAVAPDHKESALLPVGERGGDRPPADETYRVTHAGLDAPLPPGVEAIGELDVPLGDGRPLLLVQNQQADGAELRLMRWDGFDLILEMRVANRTGASYELTNTDDSRVAFETLDFATATQLSSFEIAWDGGQPVVRETPNRVANRLDEFFRTPSWASDAASARGQHLHA